MPLKKLKIIFLVASLIFGSIGFYSFNNAKKVADKIVAPVSHELKRAGCYLSLFKFKNGKFTEEYSSVGWKVLYDTDETYSNYVEIYLSLSGLIEMTNPRDLVERIKINSTSMTCN